MPALPHDEFDSPDDESTDLERPLRLVGEEAADSSLTWGWLVIVRKIIVAVVGTAVLIAGAVMLFVPGPGLVVVTAGLALLATEFRVARRWLDRLKARASRLLRRG